MNIGTASYKLWITILAILIVGSVTIRYVFAQVDATSSDANATSAPVTELTDTTGDKSPHPQIEGAPTSDSEQQDAILPPADDSSQNSETPVTSTAQEAVALDGLVEVKLQCSQSYTADVYDTPSGRLDPYVESDVATTTDTVVHVIGQQSYTVCHDARGNVHEFPITADEYAALSVRGTPQKSVREPVDQAALDSFKDTSAAASDGPTPAVTSAAMSDTPTSPESSSSTPIPVVLSASTSAADTSTDITSTSTSTPAPTTTSTNSTTTSTN